jgi:energy-coupling factor transporter ATP-binding protein EcfA2
MERINQITITNYRAFYNEQGHDNKYQINLPNGENLLIYGENGSGKSSLFRAMQDFFHSAKKEITPQQNIFTEGQPDLPDTSIKIRYTNNDEFEFNRLSSTAFNHPFFRNVKSSFLTYRDILNTYFLNLSDDKNNPDLYHLFINEILFCLAGTNEISEIISEIDSLKNRVNTFDIAYRQAIKGIEQRDQKEEIFQTLKADLKTGKKDLNNKLTSLINRLLRVVNHYLKNYFNFNFSVSLKKRSDIINVRFSKNILKIKESLYFEIKIFDSEINKFTYQSFLNEARLSALALAMYLAALSIENKRLPDQNHKFLFLDDIFIGLDTSNRIPLLEILTEKFDAFQIFITTYDRHWFEVAKNWLERKSGQSWKSFELFTDDFTYTDKEIPKLLGYKEAISQALYYYKKSDYSASGNYLRKACEEVLAKILPQICLKDSNGMGLERLSQKIERALYFFNMVGKPTDDLDSLAVYLQSLMNPLSHYDLDTSVFRKELKEVEQSVSKLSKMDLAKYSFKLIVPKGNMIKLTYQVDAVTFNVYEIKVKEDLWIYKENDNAPVQLSACQCRNENLYEINNGTKGQEFHLPLEHESLKTFYEESINFENQQKGLNIFILPDYETLYEYEMADKTWDKLLNIMRFK